MTTESRPSPNRAASFLAELSDNSLLVPVLLLLLFAAAFLIRVWGLSYFHYWDEMVYLQNAKVICCGKTNYSELSFRPPLLSLIFAAAFLIRDHMFSACVAAAALNALAPVLLFLSGQRIVGRLAAALGSILLAFGPFFVGVFPAGFDSDDTGNSLLTDSPALTLLLLGLWLMLKALQRQRGWRFALAGFALSLAILMRFGSIPGVALLCLMPLATKHRWKSLGWTIAGVFAGLGPYLLWSRMTYGGFLATIREAWTHVEGPAPPFTFYLSNAPAIFTWMGVAGVLLAAGAGLAQLVRSRREAALTRRAMLPDAPAALRGFLWLWLLLALLFFSTMQHKEPRYILPAAPPVLLLAGWGIAMLCRGGTTRLRALGSVAVGVGMLVVLLPSRSRFEGPFVVRAHPEEMDASAFLDSRFPAGTPVYMNFNYPAFAYFSDLRIRELPIGGPEVYRAIHDIPEGGLLIAYRQNESGDPRVEVLDQDASLVPLKRYQTLTIYQRVRDGVSGRP